ncbi:hypothetical protein NLJ89_g5092 [Agrocybe chaxingu]|uniref:F-box domain-containing protein n=1 Tax=Agrocybe chaxingu TaxID=84603 RepID=A0A9W8K1T2_9AGAR|nr:hypothetical protein NLJ89_g5092 [Agrocybe chaxingu]
MPGNIIPLMTSPTPSLVETNGIPSPEEEMRIREAIRLVQQELDNIRREGVWYAIEQIAQSGIPDAQQLLDNRSLISDEKNAESYKFPLFRLEINVRNMFIGFIEQHEALLSSVRRFPPELLVEIFSWVVQESPFPTKHSTAYPYELAFFNRFQALAFTHVCAYWRQVALSRPQLWTSIPFFDKIYLNGSVKAEVKGSVNLVRLYLERSRDFPIHVRVWLPYSGSAEGDPADAASSEPLRSILQHTDRWKSAVLQVCPAIYESFPTLDFPLLHALNLRIVLPTGPDRIREGDYRGPNTVFQSTPQLRTLVLDSKPMLPELEEFLNPLTTFIGLPVGVAYLAACPKLVKCEFRGPAGMLSVADPPDAFKHEGIRSFRLVNTNCALPLGGEFTTTFFCSIKMPNLEVLEIEGPTTIEAAPVVLELLGMTLATPSLLRSFTFHVRGVTKGELCLLLGVMPLLEVLDIWDMPSSHLHLLTLKDKRTSGDCAEAPPFLVSRLRSLTIREFSDPDFKTLEQVYESRLLSRCQSREPSTTSAVDHDLTIFLTYRHARGCARYQNLIEGWQEVEPGKHAKGSECTRLLGWAAYLVKNFLGFDSWGPDCVMKHFEFTGRGRFPKASWDTEKYDKFFKVVEEYDMKDGRLLEMTRLYRIMSAVRDLFEEHPYGDPGFSLRDRAGELVKKWTPLVEQSAKGRLWKISEDGRTLRLGEEFRPRKIEVEI